MMASFLFISINDINAHGIRVLSSYLKREGHKTSIVFLKRPGFPYTFNHEKYLRESKKVAEYDWTGIHHDGTPFRYSRGPEITTTEKELLLSLINKINPNVIGFSVTAPLIDRIGKISLVIRENVSIPIIFGGAGATIDPEGCLDFCDVACVGEGEKTVLDIAKKIDGNSDFFDVKNLCYLTSDGKIVKNPIYPLIQNLDELPFQDLDPHDKYLIDDDSVVENFKEFSYVGRYHMMGSRGCPFQCSYCTESYYKRLYSSDKFLRRRSPRNVVDEIKLAKKYSDFSIVQFEDEIFSLEYDWLEEFSELYKKEVNLPFTCYIYPIRNLDRQLKLLKDAGVFDICLSLQSGSDYINKKVFKRVFKEKVYLETAQKLEELGIKFYTDVITYNPFEKEDDLKSTLDILLQIPTPLIVFINKLYILKNTSISTLIDSANPKNINRTPNRVFDYYVRLFWFSFAEGKRFVRFCQKVKLFKYFPFLLRSDWVTSKIRLLLK